MIDDILFQRGEILTKIDGETEDYDVRIPDYYFMNVLGLKGEVIEGNGSQYNLVLIDADDNFVIDFDVDEVDFEKEDGGIVSFTQLIVRCTGKVAQVDNDYDILEIADYNVIRVV